MNKEVILHKDIFLTTPEIHLFLDKYFSYYKTLDPFWKNIFCERVEYFTKTKNFVGNEGFVPNNQVKAIISASAIQLTLGLEVWDLHYFDTIIVFPGDFENKQSGLKLKGETNLAGFVSLSWKSFIQGYRIRDDNLNLGIHEFTHALRFNGIKNENTDYFFSNYFAKWYCVGRKEFSNLAQNKPSIFRAYGGSNVNEFLSVVVEHFFESPQQFKTELPLLYSATAILLNQKQENNSTKVNVRKDELSSHPVFSPLPSLAANVSFFKSTSAYIGLIFLSLGIFTVLKAGLLSFPSLFLFLLGFANLIMSDYRYTHGTIESNKIHISKGFLLFKNRKRFMIPFQHLMSADFFPENRKDETVMLTFLNNDDYFYEETFHLKINTHEKQDLADGLRKNFVWVKFSL